MTTIRSNPFPQAHQPPLRDDSAKLAAQRAFFAAIAGQPQPAAAAPAETTRPAQTVAQTVDPGPQASGGMSADRSQKIARPGSLFDIRV